MAKYFLILLLTITGVRADTNLVWQLPYIRPYLLMRGTNSGVYNECWDFENMFVSSPQGTQVLAPTITNAPFDLFISTLNTNFTYTTSNHVANRIYYYNSAYLGIRSNVQAWVTNTEIVFVQTNTVTTNVSSLSAPRLLGIFESW